MWLGQMRLGNGGLAIRSLHPGNRSLCRSRRLPGKGSLVPPTPPISEKVSFRMHLGCWVLHAEQW